MLSLLSYKVGVIYLPEYKTILYTYDNMKTKRILIIATVLICLFSSCFNKEPEKNVEPVQLTNSGFDRFSYLSPNGHYIAFTSVRNTHDPYSAGVRRELFIMDRDGTNERLLLSTNELYEETDVWDVVWDNNSEDMLVRIRAYNPFPHKQEIWKVNISGNKNRISPDEQRVRDIKLSPNGLKIAYLVSFKPNDRLYSANTDFSDTVLIDESYIIGEIDWQWNSEGIIYSLYDTVRKNYDLWKADINGSGNIRFTETMEDEEYLSCSKVSPYLTTRINKNVYISSTEKYSPELLMENAYVRQWIPGRELILAKQLIDSIVYTDYVNHIYQPVVINRFGEILHELDDITGYFSFSSKEHYYTYSDSGNIWMDYLP